MLRSIPVLALMLSACGAITNSISDTEGASPLAVTTLSIDSVTSDVTFNAISREAGGLVTQGRSAKFFIDYRNPQQARIFFLNGNFTENGRTPDAALFHYSFAKRALNIPEDDVTFNKVTYFQATKRYIAGTVQRYTDEKNNSSFYGIQFYPQDVIKENVILQAVSIVKSTFHVPNAQMAFVATGSQQTVATVLPGLQQLNVRPTTVQEILGKVNFIPMNLGEAYGYLRVFPKDNDALEGTDIPVFDELPLDLTVVSGVITKAFQDSNSHVNLKSKERGTPNMVLRDASLTHAKLQQFADKPVKLTVTKHGFTIENSTDAIIKAKYQAKLNRPWLPVKWDTETRLMSYDAMCPRTPADCFTIASKYGSKAANLGFLNHNAVLGTTSTPSSLSGRLGYDLAPFGFGVPLQKYADLMSAPQNSALKTALDDFIAQEKNGQLSNKERTENSAKIRELFLNAYIDPALVSEVKQKMAALAPNQNKWKIRSSANAEDIPNFDGAGLHDSYSAKLDAKDPGNTTCLLEWELDKDTNEMELKIKPKTVDCAIKGVYASLWNKRAIEERSFARLDHATVSMGLSVLPAYDFESKVAANSVLVTRAVNTQDVYGYAISSQRGNNVVTNPAPGTYSQVMIAAFISPSEPVSLSILRFAKAAANETELTASVLEKKTMLDMIGITQQIETAYCKYKRGYYNGPCQNITFDVNKPKSLDLEIKHLENGHFVFKQVREFSGK